MRLNTEGVGYGAGFLVHLGSEVPRSDEVVGLQSVDSSLNFRCQPVKFWVSSEGSLRDVPQVLFLIQLSEPSGGNCVIEGDDTGKNVPFFGSVGFGFEERNVDDPDGVFEAAGYV